MQLQTFKEEFNHFVLNLLWRQWSAIGVSGHADTSCDYAVDPEALLLITASVARFDQRLFDEALDWLARNERFVNAQRLRTMMRNGSFSATRVIAAIAATQMTRRVGLKWKGLAGTAPKVAEVEPLFFLATGEPLPVGSGNDEIFLRYGFVRNPVENRNLSRPFTPGQPATLLLQLRALFGLTSRSEILLYLLVRRSGTIQEIAHQTGYAWRSVQDVLFELGHSGILSFPEAKKGRIYHCDSSALLNLLSGAQVHSEMKWIGWASLFSVFEAVHSALLDAAIINAPPLVQSAHLRELMTKRLITGIHDAGISGLVKDDRAFQGEGYLEYFVATMRDIMKEVS